jgi:oligopeptidase A
LGSKNPLTIKDGLPRFVDIKPADVLPAIESDLETLQSEFGDFESRMAAVAESAKYPEVIEDLEKIQFPLGTSWSIVNHLLGVRNSDELRDSHKAVQPKVISMYQRLGQSQPLFKALKTLKEKEALDEAKDRIVTSAIRQMESSGVGLEDAKREAFNKMQLEMADLQTKFSNNVLDSTKAFKLEISEKAKLEGLPASTLRLLAQQVHPCMHACNSRLADIATYPVCPRYL